MLAALLLNLEEELQRGPILRGTGSISISRDVHKAAHKMKDIVFPEYLPKPIQAKMSQAFEKVFDYVELPGFAPAVDAIKETQAAISTLKDLQKQITEPEWLFDIRLSIERLVIISARITDDEEALLLLM